MQPNRTWIKPIWPPQNLKCTFLHTQTRYERNSNGYTYVFGDRLLIGTHENTMRPNRKWIKPLWRPLNVKCTFLHSQMSHQRNFKGYTYVFGDRLSIGTHDNTMRPNPELDKTNMAASKPKMHVSSLTDQISAKFQRLYLCFLGPAFHWDSREYYATKPAVEYSNMAASILEMHVSALPDKISSKFLRLYLFFGFRLPNGTHEHAIRPKLKLTNPIWWIVTLKCMYLHSKLKYQRNSNDYTYVLGTGFSSGPTKILCDQTGSGKYQYRGL